MFRVIVVGFGIQGKKRKAVAGDECVAVVDTLEPQADYKEIYELPLHTFDAALVCTPDEAKEEILTYLLEAKKHVLVEKPLLTDNLQKLSQLAEKNNVTCYTAYNHRFEPHFAEAKKIIDSGVLGEIYHLRLFYGNGTAADVKASPWRDKGAGVLTDLGSHLLDTLFFWFDGQDFNFKMLKCNRFENKSPDHILLLADSPFSVEMEMSLLSWRNHFSCDLIASAGSLHIESLCKWGPSKLTIRTRVLPSGRPTEKSTTLVQPDPTWALEYEHFKKLCQNSLSNIGGDIKIYETFSSLMQEAAL